MFPLNLSMTSYPTSAASSFPELSVPFQTLYFHGLATVFCSSVHSEQNQNSRGYPLLNLSQKVFLDKQQSIACSHYTLGLVS